MSQLVTIDWVARNRNRLDMATVAARVHQLTTLARPALLIVLLGVEHVDTVAAEADRHVAGGGAGV